MNKFLRNTITLLLIGPVWYLGLMSFFVYSGAQNILANTEFQSKKFIEVFAVLEPLPRMVGDGWFVLKGLFICGALLGVAIIYINKHINGSWLIKGLRLGLICWVMVIP